DLVCGWCVASSDFLYFFFSSRRRHTRSKRDWSSDVCSSDLFPWNAFGYALSEPLALAQTASLIGLWGMTFLSVAIFASPAVLIRSEERRVGKECRARWRP